MDTPHTGHTESPTFFFGYCRQCSAQESHGEASSNWLEDQPAQPVSDRPIGLAPRGEW